MKEFQEDQVGTFTVLVNGFSSERKRKNRKCKMKQ